MICVGLQIYHKEEENATSSGCIAISATKNGYNNHTIASENFTGMYFYISYHWSSGIYIQLFLNTNRDVSALVKLATRSGLVSYVGKVVAPGDWDNITRNIIFRGGEGEIILQ